MTEIMAIENPVETETNPADVAVPTFIADLFSGAKRQVAFSLFADHTLKSGGINNVDIAASCIQAADPTVNRQMVVAYRNEGYTFPDNYKQELFGYLQNFLFEDPEDPTWVPSKMEIEMSFNNPLKAQLYFFALDLDKILKGAEKAILDANIPAAAPTEKPRQAVIRRVQADPRTAPKQYVIDIPASSVKVARFVAHAEIAGTRYQIDPRVAMAISDMMAAMAAKGLHPTEFVQSVAIEST